MKLTATIKKKLPGFSLDVDFDADNDPLGLLGASGSGKSMTLRCIAGLDKPDSGRIVLNGNVLFDSEKGINIPCRKRKIGFLFQNYALFPHMTVRGNIGFALEDLEKEQRDSIVQSMIKIVKLEGLEKRVPSQLSGGQQQRVALARALAINPEALLLDEPFSALDDHLRSHMLKQLMDILLEFHGITLFVTHNIDESYRVCKNLVVLNGGSVEAIDKKEDLFLKPPTLATAQLTNCKNISRSKKLSPRKISVLDWGIELTTLDSVDDELKHVGIRAHHIRTASENDIVNVIDCWPCFTSEGPFRMTVYLSLGNEPSHLDEYQLMWDMAKEEWYELKDRLLPWKICLDPYNLILMNK